MDWKVQTARYFLLENKGCWAGYWSIQALCDRVLSASLACRGNADPCCHLGDPSTNAAVAGTPQTDVTLSTFKACDCHANSETNAAGAECCEHVSHGRERCRRGQGSAAAVCWGAQKLDIKHTTLQIQVRLLGLHNLVSDLHGCLSQSEPGACTFFAPFAPLQMIDLACLACLPPLN